MKLFTPANNIHAAKALIAARYAGKTVEVAAADEKKHPLGKAPVLETAEGLLFEPLAIARYIARGTPFYGKDLFEAAAIDQWVEFCFAELELPLAAWMLPYTAQGVARNDAVEKRAKSDVRRALGAMNTHLVAHTFLVGERVTLADVAVAAGLFEAYKLVLDAGFRKEFRALNRWFTTVVNQPNVHAVLGDIHLCEKAPAAPKVEAPKKEEAPAPKPKKEEKPKEEKKPKKEEKKDDDDDDEPKEEKKAPNPLDLLPPSKLVMDAWKRTYSNEDTRAVALPWFYENYDPEGYSLWFANYKDVLDTPHEFMVANLIGGFIQRLEPMRKYGFGSLMVFGEPTNWKIEGVFLFRGKEIPADMKECPDFESYSWRRMDLEAEKKVFEEFMTWEGDFGGKTFKQGKIYK